MYGKVEAAKLAAQSWQSPPALPNMGCLRPFMLAPKKSRVTEEAGVTCTLGVCDRPGARITSRAHADVSTSSCRAASHAGRGYLGASAPQKEVCSGVGASVLGGLIRGAHSTVRQTTRALRSTSCKTKGIKRQHEQNTTARASCSCAAFANGEFNAIGARFASWVRANCVLVFGTGGAKNSTPIFA